MDSNKTFSLFIYLFFFLVLNSHYYYYYISFHFVVVVVVDVRVENSADKFFNRFKFFLNFSYVYI